MSMSPARFKSIYNCLSAVARRVYDATPIADQWDISTIQTELTRLGLPVREYRALQGIIGSLVESGIVEEPSKGCFRRTKVAEIKLKKVEPQSPQSNQQNTMNTKLATAPAAVDPAASGSPLDKLASLANQARGLSQKLATLAIDIENAALEVEEEFVANSRDSEKLKQLQALLKGI
jgi:hypothetical protein